VVLAGSCKSRWLACWRPNELTEAAGPVRLATGLRQRRRRVNMSDLVVAVASED
jgi:hypothetical protein